jgi:hypothetical protein
MGAAEIILALVQGARIAMEVVEKYQKGDLTDEQLMVEWEAMKGRLGAVSDRIRA